MLFEKKSHVNGKHPEAPPTRFEERQDILGEKLKETVLALAKTAPQEESSDFEGLFVLRVLIQPNVFLNPVDQILHLRPQFGSGALLT